jgi:hypothetical protein
MEKKVNKENRENRGPGTPGRDKRFDLFSIRNKLAETGDFF